MERRKASDFPAEVLKLFDGYVHGSLTAAISSTVRRNTQSADSPPPRCSKR